MSGQAPPALAARGRGLPSASPRPLDGLGVGLVVLTAFLWGSNFVAAKFGLQGLPPVTLAALRAGFGALVLLGAVWFKGASWGVPRRALPTVALVGVVHTAVPFGLTFWAVRFTEAGRATLLMATQPFMVALLAHWLLPGERLTRRRAVGLVLGFLGVAVITWHRVGGGWGLSLLGEGLVLVAAASWAVATVLARPLARDLDALHLTTAQMASAALALALGAALLEAGQPWALTATVAASVVYLGLVTTAATLFLWFFLLGRYGAATVVPFVFLQPVFAAVQGYLVLGESITGNFVLGTALIAIGLARVARA